MNTTTNLNAALDTLTTEEYLELSTWMRRNSAEAKGMTQTEIDEAVAARVAHTIEWRGAE